MSQYLDNGGNLFISGQYSGYSIFKVGSIDGRDFVRNYFGLEWLKTSNSKQVVGIPGDPISHGLEFNIWQPMVSSAYQFPEILNPVNGGKSFFSYFDGQTGGVRYENNYKLVYLGFGLEAVDSDRNTQKGEFSAIRDTLFTRTLSWFSFLEHKPLNDTEELTRSRIATVNLAPNIMNPGSLKLYWRRKGNQQFHHIIMSAQEANMYSAIIPAPKQPTIIEYYIKAENEYYTWTHPVGVPTKLHHFYAGPDRIAPELGHITELPNRLSTQVENPVRARVTDNVAVNSQTVFIEYRVNNSDLGGPVKTVPMQRDGDPDFFVGSIPPKFSIGDTVKYRIKAVDASHAENIAHSDWFSFQVGFDDFEDDLTYWNYPENSWWLANARGNHYLKHTKKISYPENQDVSLTLKDGLDLSNARQAELQFSTLYTIEKDKDFGYIEVQRSQNSPGTRLDVAITGYNPSNWITLQVPLDEFVGDSDVRIRFRFVSDSTQSKSMRGWYLDNVRVVQLPYDRQSTHVEQLTQAPNEFKLYANYPNPFNPTTTIAYDLPHSAHVRLTVFDVLGRQVKALKNEPQDAGRHQVKWDATNESGSRVAAGIYFYRIEAEHFVSVKKMVWYNSTI